MSVFPCKRPRKGSKGDKRSPNASNVEISDNADDNRRVSKWHFVSHKFYATLIIRFCIQVLPH
jgi:hypothetical protein